MPRHREAQLERDQLVLLPANRQLTLDHLPTAARRHGKIKAEKRRSNGAQSHMENKTDYERTYHKADRIEKFITAIPTTLAEQAIGIGRSTC